MHEESAEADHVKLETPPGETTAGSAVSVTAGPPSFGPEQDMRHAAALMIAISSRLAAR
jgi:hypothetical protein